jgi:hypothetical protein
MQADLPIASLWTGRHGALRAGSAGEQPATAYGTCLPVLQIHPTPGTSQDLHREANLNMRLTGGFPPVHALFSSVRATAAYRRQKLGKSSQSIEMGFCPVPHLPGPEKTRSSPRAEFSRGFGVGFEVGVRTPDSHALSNTWESVQKSGLLRNGVFLNGDV